MPAARPSRPSTRLTALAMPITHSTVTSADRSAESTTRPENGTRKYTMLTPLMVRMLPASTRPATLAGADTSNRSSMKPTA